MRTYTDKSPNGFKILIAECISIFLRRTTLLTKLKERTGEAGVKIINDLILIFDIKTTGGTGVKPANEVTFARIAATFPMVTIKMFNDPAYFRFIGDISAAREVPLGVCIPIAAYFYGYIGDQEYNQWLDWAYSFDRVIHSNPQGQLPNPTKVKQVADAVRASGRQNMTEGDAQRIWDVVKKNSEALKIAYNKQIGKK
jgi:hypothetical protein